MKARIHLVIEHTDGRSWNVEIDGERITADMLDVAEDLLETLATGDRPPIKGLYDLCAQAFNVSRDDAKKRIVAASYGMSKAKIEDSSSRGQALAQLAAASAKPRTTPLGREIQEHAKYQIRGERHPDDPDKKGDEA